MGYLCTIMAPIWFRCPASPPHESREFLGDTPEGPGLTAPQSQDGVSGGDRCSEDEDDVSGNHRWNKA